MKNTASHTAGKKKPGHISSSASSSQPPPNMASNLPRETRSTGPARMLRTGLRLATSSAAPKTAGITVEKLSEANMKYSQSEKNSRPR